MTNSSPKEELKYRALAEAALAAAAGETVEVIARKGLAAAVEYIGLTAGALTLWNSKGNVVTSAVEAKRDADREILEENEKSLLSMLRKNFKLSSAYMEFGEPVQSVFSLPIEIGPRQIGALIGVKAGRAHLHEYDEFLRALASILSLALAPGRMVNELAVGVNHEINNLLTPLLGNLDLLFRIADRLPDDVRRKLDVIRDSATQIKEVTARLKEVSRLPRVPYVDGEWMVKLSGEDEDAEKKNDTTDVARDDGTSIPPGER